jgi:hypothetical protein
MFPLNEMIDSLNSIYSKSFSFLSFQMEKFQKSTFDWEILNCSPALFGPLRKVFKTFKIYSYAYIHKTYKLRKFHSICRKSM